jgi:hypothetical protein
MLPVNAAHALWLNAKCRSVWPTVELPSTAAGDILSPAATDVTARDRPRKLDSAAR